MKTTSIYFMCVIFISHPAFAGFIAKKIATGVYHTCALSTDGQVKCWGSNSYGGLGTGDSKNVGDYPDSMGKNLHIVDLGTGVVARDVCGGQDFTCVATTDGRVKCWGLNHLGSLAHGNDIHSLEMGDKLPISNLGQSFKAVSVACGNFHACALSDVGQIKCWGDNSRGQLGNNGFGNVGNTPETIGENIVGVAIAKPALSISAGSAHSCARFQDGDRCWGYGFEGAVGQESSSSIGWSSFPLNPDLPSVKLDLNTIPISVSQVTAGRDFSCASFVRGQDPRTYLKCWGENYHNQLGNDSGGHGAQSGTMGERLPLSDIGLDSMISIEAHSNFGCALNQQGILKCWGRNYDGELGLGTFRTPQLGSYLPSVQLGLPVKSLSVGSLSFHSCAILINSEIKCWGKNNEGQLGYEHTNTVGGLPNDMGENLPFVKLN